MFIPYAIYNKFNILGKTGFLTQDANANNIADGWGANNPVGGNITIVRSVSGGQVINISASTVNGDRGGIFIEIPITINTDYKVNVEQKVSSATGTFNARARVYQAGTPVVETNDTNTEYENKTLNFTTDGVTATIFIYLQGHCDTGGDTGIAYFKNVKLMEV